MHPFSGKPMDTISSLEEIVSKCNNTRLVQYRFGMEVIYIYISLTYNIGMQVVVKDYFR